MNQSITRFSSLKTRACEIREIGGTLPQNHLIKKARLNLSGCANWLLLKDYYTVGETRLAKTNTCKQHLLCPFCASRRASKLVQKNMPKVEKLIEENKHLIPVMLTYTVKNGDDLRERFDHLSKSFRTLTDRRRDKLKKGWGKTETSKIQGAYFSYEFTHTDDGGYHPHIHCVALLDSYIDQSKLSKEWHDITGDSFIVDIRKIKKKTREKGSESESELFDGLAEVFKYALKFQDMEAEQIWHAWETLKGKRLIGSFGSLWGLKMPDSLLDDDLADLPFIEKFYTYSRASESFQLRTFANVSEHGEILNHGSSNSENNIPSAFDYSKKTYESLDLPKPIKTPFLANGPTEGSHRENLKCEASQPLRLPIMSSANNGLLSGCEDRHSRCP